MAIFSMRTRNKLWGYGLTGLLSMSAIIIQTGVLSNLPVQNVYVNLPLTMVIVWGAVFGSPLPPITPDELRISTLSEVFTRQLFTGSILGALVGALFACLYAALIPIFPVYLPLIGWISGYFCLRNINKQTLLCMPLVFVMTLLGETIMAVQLALAGHHYVIEHLFQIAMPEAILNMFIAPFVYFPMRRWYDFAQVAQVPLEID
jgi:rod shape-determining protein MreD